MFDLWHILKNEQKSQVFSAEGGVVQPALPQYSLLIFAATPEFRSKRLL